MNSDRDLNLDLLRIIAAYAVIIIHICSRYFYQTGVLINHFEWIAVCFWESVTRWAVPVFFMISGAVFLKKKRDVSIKMLYAKYVLHLTVVYAFWALGYSLYHNRIYGLQGVLRNWLPGEFHMWYLKVLIGVYILIPVAREIIKDEQTERYFLFLALFLNTIIPSIGKLIHLSVVDEVLKVINEMNIHMPIGYIGCFLLGHYMYSHAENEKDRTKIKRIQWIYFLVFVSGILFTFVMTIGTYYRSGNAEEIWLEYLSPGVLVAAIGLFGMVINQSDRMLGKHLLDFVAISSKDMLAVYMIHIGVISIFNSYGINALLGNMAYSIPTLGILVWIISAVIGHIMRKIPILRYMA